MNTKRLILAITAGVALVGMFIFLKINKTLDGWNIPINGIKPVACTEEAKLCPDGSRVGRAGPKCEFALCPSVAFDTPVAFSIHDEIVFPDGLSITLRSINDSRCKPDVQCIWQGELAPTFTLNHGEEVRLGTVNNKRVTTRRYTFALQKATTASTTIMVTKTP